MEYRVLKYFLCVVREGSFSRAAEQLHVTQPTLSRQIAELEEQLGKKLFDRGTRYVELTEDGLFLKQRAEEIIALSDKTEMELMSSNLDLSGDIYIGGGETIGMKVITKVIKKVINEQPNIKFHLFSGNADTVIEKLENGTLSFGLLLHSKVTENYESIEIPLKDRCGILMRKDDPLAKKEFITFKDLKGKPIITSSQNRNDLISRLNINPKNFNIVATYNLIYNASLMVEDGIGYCLAIDNIINTKGSNLVFRPISPNLEINLNLVYKKYKFFSKASNYFLDKLKDELNK